MKAILIPTKLGLNSCQVMKMLALAGLHFMRRGTRDSKAGSASNSGNLSMVLPLSPPPGDRLSAFRVKGAKQGVEC